MTKIISDKNSKTSDNKIYYFKKTIHVEYKTQVVFNIFADARYKLYINQKLVAVGPCKGCERERYYDTVDVTDFLHEGDNDIFAQVLQLASPSDFGMPRFLTSVYRTGVLCFALWGDEITSDGKTNMIIETNHEWEVAAENAIGFISPVIGCYASLNESVDGSLRQNLQWEKASEICDFQYNESAHSILYGECNPWFSQKRTIPMMFIKDKAFLKTKNNIYDAGELTTGFIKMKCHGTGRLTLTYAESYVFEENGCFVKRDRADENGVIHGDMDKITLNGQQISYETYWFRTFRYVQLSIEGDISIDELSYQQTAYPLEVSGTYDFADETDNRLWDISLHTLKCCMQESYTDCPYYEQLQYSMDTQLQMLFNYQVSKDDQLARKGIHDFALSQQPDGMIQSRFPSIIHQIIPGFGIFFIFMIRDHYRRFADISLVKQYTPNIDAVLMWFHQRLMQDGLVGNSQFWNFIDWAQGWEGGVPTTEPNEPISIFSLMYAVALDAAAELNEAVGRTSTANEYRENKKSIIQAVNSTCYDAKQQLYANGPLKQTFCQHTQVWAVLSGAIDLEKGAELLIRSMNLEAKSTFAFDYFLFRALDLTGLYHLRTPVLDGLRALIDLHCTTVPETPTDSRSECHAWGAVPIYEFTAMDLGIRDINTPEKSVTITPYIKDRAFATGEVPTIYGNISVSWKKEGDTFTITIHSPQEYRKNIELPDGQKLTSTDDALTLTCQL